VGAAIIRAGLPKEENRKGVAWDGLHSIKVQRGKWAWSCGKAMVRVEARSLESQKTGSTPKLGQCKGDRDQWGS